MIATQTVAHPPSKVGARATSLRVVTALVMIHVVDDRFLQPEPGTAATDHLISGLVVLAALHLAAAMAPRLGSGIRAIVATAVGRARIIAGALGGDAALHAGPARDDYTGIAAMVAVPPYWSSRESISGERGDATSRDRAAICVEAWSVLSG